MEISCAMVVSVVRKRKRKRKDRNTYPSIYAQVAAYNNQVAAYNN
jgi:hypothetical protein